MQYNLIVANGYPAETHRVHTADGYILTMYRLPNPGRPVVFLQHGLLSSSADFVVLGKGRALGEGSDDATVLQHDPSPQLRPTFFINSITFHCKF